MAQASARPASVADFTFRAADKTTEDLKVTGFTGTEEISRLFSFRVELCSDDADITFDEIVGKPCVLEIRAASGSRYVNGIVRRFVRTGEGTNLTHYAAEIVPVHWLLTKRHKSRIFQESSCADMTIPGIIQKVLEDAGIPSDNYRFALQGSYGTREYVVQYRESEMNFVSRLMEEEGIFFFFEHTADGHVMVIGDSPVAHTGTPNEEEFAYREQTGLVTAQEQEYVYGLRDGQEIQTGAVALTDYNFQQPRADLKAAATADQYAALEYSDYPGKYVEKSVGDRYATIRLEEFQCQKRVQQMEATVRALLPGFKFTLTDHPNEAHNREYLVTHLTHQARQPQSAEEEATGKGIEYHVSVRTMPSDVSFRAPRITPRPVIQGTQTAIVVGPAGEDLYTDKYGRVKVQYFWDRQGQFNENSSRWTRVAQSAAGGGYGIMFLPRVGQEVVIAFLEGDPDKPLITGCVYNSDQMPPYELPGEKTKSCIKSNTAKGGGGTNEIRFEDKKNGEQFLVHASRDMHTRVQKDRITDIAGEEHVTVVGNSVESVAGAKHIAIGTDLVEQVGANHSLAVGGSYAHTIGGSASMAIGANLLLSVGSKILISAGSEITLKAGGSFIKIDGSGVTVQGSTVKINSGGSAGSVPKRDPEKPKKTKTADKVVPGRDVTYNKETEEYVQVETGEMEPQPKSWVEVELTDDEGNPMAGEFYEVITPNGDRRAGTLDQHGVAREDELDPGNCEINFPRLDREGWRR
jgi:type VI secretion system secreted protein VgrG